MIKGFFNIPNVTNEKVLSYEPGSPERITLKAALAKLEEQVIEIPMYIGSEKVKTGDIRDCTLPHDHQKVIGKYHYGDASHVTKAINAALEAKEQWENMSWEHRASIFLKAAELIAGPYRAEFNAATMLAQSKNIFQAEIDAVCELVDFLRFNVQYMTQIYSEQPDSAPGIWNRLEYRPLEGFIFALTPFNFTSIAGNLPSSAALMGNTVVWKPANSQIYSANMIMKIFKEAGLPDGVINLIYVDGPTAGDIIFKHADFAGLHFTGSTGVFQHLWKTIGTNISKYKTYPKIVGETGGKDFILAHPSADKKAVAVAISRGAFEFQGQKCSAASRVYLPKSMSFQVIDMVLADLESFKMGDVNDFTNFINAVIDKKAFDKITGYIKQAKEDGVKVLAGGNFDDSKGYFIEPTILLCEDPKYTTMQEEIFGPVLSIFIYDDEKWTETLTLLDETSPYALTGAVFSQDRYAAEEATNVLRNAAGNFYINDKPTGAVVNQQPFGGARASGTNDKAGSVLNLIRWVSPRTIKESFVPPKNYHYPFLLEE